MTYNFVALVSNLRSLISSTWFIGIGEEVCFECGEGTWKHGIHQKSVKKKKCAFKKEKHTMTVGFGFRLPWFEFEEAPLPIRACADKFSLLGDFFSFEKGRTPVLSHNWNELMGSGEINGKQVFWGSLKRSQIWLKALLLFTARNLPRDPAVPFHRSRAGTPKNLWKNAHSQATCLPFTTLIEVFLSFQSPWCVSLGAGTDVRSPKQR